MQRPWRLANGIADECHEIPVRAAQEHGHVWQRERHQVAIVVVEEKTLQSTASVCASYVPWPNCDCQPRALQRYSDDVELVHNALNFAGYLHDCFHQTRLPSTPQHAVRIVALWWSDMNDWHRLETFVLRALLGDDLGVALEFGCVGFGRHEVLLAVPNHVARAQQVPADVAGPRCHDAQHRVHGLNALDIADHNIVDILQKVVGQVVAHAPVRCDASIQIHAEPVHELRHECIV